LSLARRFTWPVALVIAFAAFWAITSGNDTQAAKNYGYGYGQEGDFCAIDGPSVIQQGKTYLYVGRMDGVSRHDTTVSIDNIIGSSKITSVVSKFDKDDDYKDYYYDRYRPRYHEITPANQIQDVPNYSAFKIDKYLLEILKGKFKDQEGLTLPFPINLGGACGLTNTEAITRLIADGIAAGEACAPTTTAIVTTVECTSGYADNCTNPNPSDARSCLFGDWDIDCTLGLTCTIASAVVTAIVNSIVRDLERGEWDCDDIAINAAKASIVAGVSTFVDEQVFDFVFTVCKHDWVAKFMWGDPYYSCKGDFYWEDSKYGYGDGYKYGDNYKYGHCGGYYWESFVDSLVIVDVTCQTPGNFDITFTDEKDPTDAISKNVTCVGRPTAASTITALPTTVEISPALGNIAQSLVWVRLVDSTGGVTGGGKVAFTTDRCAIEAASVTSVSAGNQVHDQAKFTAIRGLFDAYAAFASPATAGAIAASAAATSRPDSTPTYEDVWASATTGLAGVVLSCNPENAPGTTPGRATVTATISVDGADSIIKSVTVTVVGPPAALTAAATPTTLRCGEKATITVTVKDSIGQNVSDHTRVEAVTNAGGVLAGTGAVAGQAGPVVPVSSTVAETFNGVATLFLLTSDQHVGPYEVVVTSGGAGSVAGSSLGGVFSTAAQSVQTTVTCTLPAPPAPAPAPAQPTAAAPVTPPRTGSGPITPPSTGDAGLADSGSSAWMLLALAGVAFLGTVAAFKAVRR
jgi:hypothetical protein